MLVVTHWFRKKIGLALGITTSGFGASGILVPSIVWLIDDFGWRTAVVIMGVGMWIIGIPLVLSSATPPRRPAGSSPTAEKAIPKSRSDWTHRTVKRARFLSGML